MDRAGMTRVATVVAFTAMARVLGCSDPQDSTTSDVVKHIRMDGHSVTSVVPELIIGQANGSPEYTFAQLWDVALAPSGRLLTLDPSQDRVSIYREDGQYLHGWGRSGEGPGEFAFPVDLVVTDTSVGVWDTSLRRLSWFDFEGSLLTIEGHSEWADVRRLDVADDGSFVMQTGPVWSAPPNERNGLAAVVRVTEGHIYQPLAEWNDSASVLAIVTQTSSSVIGLPFATIRRWALIDRRVLAYTPPQTAEIILTELIPDSGSGTDSTTFVIDLPLWPPSQRERDSISQRNAQRPIGIRDRVTVPTSKPVIRDMMGSVGSLWVMVSTEDDYEENLWVRLTCSGEVTGFALLPSDFQLRSASGNTLVGARRDSLGIRQVYRYRLVGVDSTASVCEVGQG